MTTIRLQGGPTVHRIAWIGPDRIIGQSYSAEARFSTFSLDGRRRRTVASPLLGPEGAPESERLKATNSGLAVCAWPGRGFVVANMSVGHIEYYDTAARRVRLADVPFPSEPRFERNDAGNMGAKFGVVRRVVDGLSILVVVGALTVLGGRFLHGIFARE